MAQAGDGAAALDSVLLDRALRLAEEMGWVQVRLSAVAERAGVPLAEVGARFRDVDALADAWFQRARLAMLGTPPEALADRAADERLAVAFERWLDTLAAHRRVTGQMLRAKLYPSHPHHWVPLIFSLSRLVHDLLDAARIEGRDRRRQAQEVGLTLLVLATLRDWLKDESQGQERSKARLRRRLRRLMACVGGTRARGDHAERPPQSTPSPPAATAASGRPAARRSAM